MRFTFFLLLATLAWGQQPPPATTAPLTPKPLVPPPMPVPSMVPPEAVILTVGDDKITKAQFDMILSTVPAQGQAQAQTPKGRRDIADKLAEILLLAQEAKAAKLDQTPKIQTQLMLSADQLLANAMFQDFRENGKPDDAMLHAYYDTHKSEWEEVKARHILIRFQGSKMPLADGKKDLTEAEALAKITELRAKIVAGADFAAVAKESSDDTGSGANGGDLGSFGRGQMVPEFDKEAFLLPVGELSQPVKSPFGYHLIKVESHQSKPFEEVKAQIAKRMPDEIAKKSLADLKAKRPAIYNDQYFK
ncbi:MAG TPA: peptidylprolyl isomerase [Bryobacteraceae bacterium]|jgi:peptidyl-prolyl cis-trans isomerase C|nr:peptidylprolyl isomerase [Bryobacteraceae bacterium]